MKRNLLISLSVIAMLISVNTFGQRGRNFKADRSAPQQRNICATIDDLSSEQEAKLTELQTAHQETRLQFRNQMDELRAQKRTLQTQSNPDMDAIENVIDQMADLRADMMKNAAAHHQEVRSLLTDEQRVQFDSRSTGPAARCEMGAGRMGRGRR